MIPRLAALGASAPLPSPSGSAPNGVPRDVQQMAREFESMLLRQLLNATTMGQEHGGYGDMAVSSLADGISRTGGIGLAQQIERALSRQLPPSTQAPSLSDSSSDSGGRSSE